MPVKKVPLFVEKVKAEGFPTGYNAITGELQDLIQAGIIDPAKVVRFWPARCCLHRWYGVDYRSPGGRNS